MLQLPDIRTVVSALWAPGLLTAGLVALVGLASIWAAVSRRHWFTRALVLTTVLLPTLAIRGHDVLLVLLLQALLTIAGISVLRIWRTRFRPVDATKRATEQAEKASHKYPQFSLLDLMLMVVVVAAICAVVAQTPPHLHAEWPAILIAGLVFACLTLWFRRELAAVIFRKDRPQWLVRKPARGRIRLACRFLISVVFPLVLMVLLFPYAYLYHRVINPLPLPTVTLPDPNGYEDLERAGEMIVNVTVPAGGTAAPEELEAFVRNNAEVFDTIRRGLNRECRAPLPSEFADMVRGGGFRQSAWALLAEGKLAEAEGRLGNAVTSYLDIVRLGEAISHGGLMVDQLGGDVIKLMGASGLVRIIDAVPRREAERAIDLLQAIDARCESPQDVLTRDRAWTDNLATDKLSRAVLLLLDSSPEYGVHDGSMIFSMKLGRARMRLAICKLAIRRYELDHNRLPNTLADLVPKYLGKVPEDPFGGQPIVYRPNSDGPTLYSIGPDGRDDHGKPI